MKDQNFMQAIARVKRLAWHARGSCATMTPQGRRLARHGTYSNHTIV